MAVDQSYFPVLRTHIEEEIPLNISITGYVLERIQRVHPEFIKTLKESNKRDLIEVLGTGYHHPLLPLIPTEDAQKHVRMDANVKLRILNKSPKGFFPPELSWSSWLIPILSDQEYQFVVLSSFGYILSSSQTATTLWKKRFGVPFPSLEMKPLVISEEINRIYQTEFEDRYIDVVFLDQELSNELIRSGSGTLARNDSKSLVNLLSRIEAKKIQKKGIILIGGDCENVSLRNLRRYRVFIKKLGDRGAPMTLSNVFSLSSKGRETLDTFAHTFLVDHGPWLSTMEDYVYFYRLNEIIQLKSLVENLTTSLGLDNDEIKKELTEAYDSILMAEDSNFVFWKTTYRSYKTGLSLIHRTKQKLDSILHKLLK